MHELSEELTEHASSWQSTHRCIAERPEHGLSRELPMTVEFWDTEGRSSTLTVTTNRELLDVLDTFPQRLPFFCEFVADNGYKLLVGIRDGLACIQHSQVDNSPPYLVAVETNQQVSDEYVDFLMANTDTPVLARYCLKFETAKQIIVHFFETGERSSAIPWEEI